MGVALASMVANLTSGKKKYADVQADIDRIIKKADGLRNELTSLVEKDAEVFEPLSRAYSLPKENEAERKIKDETMESALKSACEVPLEIMRKVVEAMDLHEELAKKGTRIAVSDVGVGAAFCKSALMGASLNVFINTKLMKNRQYAEEVNQKTEAILSEGSLKPTISIVKWRRLSDEHYNEGSEVAAIIQQELLKQIERLTNTGSHRRLRS
jgi:formiminotetrahydrofolate cyclodeaminase